MQVEVLVLAAVQMATPTVDERSLPLVPVGSKRALVLAGATLNVMSALPDERVPAVPVRVRQAVPLQFDHAHVAGHADEVLWGLRLMPVTDPSQTVSLFPQLVEFDAVRPT